MRACARARVHPAPTASLLPVAPCSPHLLRVTRAALLVCRHIALFAMVARAYCCARRQRCHRSNSKLSLTRQRAACINGRDTLLPVLQSSTVRGSGASLVSPPCYRGETRSQERLPSRSRYGHSGVGKGIVFGSAQVEEDHNRSLRTGSSSKGNVIASLIQATSPTCSQPLAAYHTLDSSAYPSVGGPISV